MVGADDPRSLHAPLLQNLEGGEMVLDPLLVFVWDTPLLRPRDLFDCAPREHRQGGGNIVLDVKPMRMPPLVGG